MKFAHVLTCFAIALGLCNAASAQTARVPVVAAENFYGDVVRQLGGDHVQVTSILNNPDEDPHLFEASPKTARAAACRARRVQRRELRSVDGQAARGIERQ